MDEFMDDLHRKEHVLRTLNAFVGSLMFTAMQVCRYIDEIAAAESVDDCLARWDGIQPTDEPQVDDMVSTIIGDVTVFLTQKGDF